VSIDVSLLMCKCDAIDGTTSCTSSNGRKGLNVATLHALISHLNKKQNKKHSQETSLSAINIKTACVYVWIGMV
jgi:hypothetical protein